MFLARVLLSLFRNFLEKPAQMQDPHNLDAGRTTTLEDNADNADKFDEDYKSFVGSISVGNSSVKRPQRRAV